MAATSYERPLVGELRKALARERGPARLQILMGPRQVGKTTAALAVAERWDGPTRYAAADEVLPPGPEWIRTQWELARRDAKQGRSLLVLDEVQKVPGWSEVVKGLWDADRRSRAPVSVILLGSSALLLGSGATESLAGRFQLHRCTHWTWPECRDAFDWNLEQWLFFGGYPGAAGLADDVPAWRAYIRDALIEAVLGRDVLAIERVTKPALLRHLFGLSCHFCARSLSYNKMLGQLQDVGNTTTLSHYLDLLEHAFLVSGLSRFSGSLIRSRGSSPKLIVWSNALVTAMLGHGFEETRRDTALWGRLVENAAGAHFVNHLQDVGDELTYFRDGDDEVDFVLRRSASVVGFEVKSGSPGKKSGLAAFTRKHPAARTLIVGAGGVPLEEFFTTDPRSWLEGSS
jgi:predicted AAA+ superfamily ATPase